MFEQQVNRILLKAKEAHITLGNTLDMDIITDLENNLGVTLPLSYTTYLTQIQNADPGKIQIRKPFDTSAITSQGLPKALEQLMLENLESRKKFEEENIKNCKIPLNHIHLDKIEPHANGPYHGIYSLNTSLSHNIRNHGFNLLETFPFEEDLDLGELANNGTSIEWDEHLKKLETTPSYAALWDEFEDTYAYNSKWLTGTLTICEYGCGDEFILVMNGKRKGEIWVNSLPGVTGIYSLHVNILTFFENWLDKEIAIRKGNQERLTNAYYAYLEFGNNKRYKVVD